MVIRVPGDRTGSLTIDLAAETYRRRFFKHRIPLSLETDGSSNINASF
jgi:hypothetical protein